MSIGKDTREALQKPYPRPAPRVLGVNTTDPVPQPEKAGGSKQGAAVRDPANPPLPNGTPISAPSTSQQLSQAQRAAIIKPR